MKQRVISAVILMAIVFTCVFASFVTRVLLFAVCGILCAYEYSRAVEQLDAFCAAWVMYVYIAVQALLALIHAGPLRYVAGITGGIYLALFSGIVHPRVSGKGALYTLAGLCYPSVLFGVLMMISVSSIWLETFALGALSCWVCDSFALFGGRRFGKHKLAPHVSPNKTIEGCLCGAAASVVVGLLIGILPIFPEISTPMCMLTCFLASSLGQVGDLAESLIKRMIGTKDFSNLIPGHGGMFDRADSLLFAIPTAYICLHLAGFGE